MRCGYRDMAMTSAAWPVDVTVPRRVIPRLEVASALRPAPCRCPECLAGDRLPARRQGVLGAVQLRLAAV